jgi:hypothetical protein
MNDQLWKDLTGLTPGDHTHAVLKDWGVRINPEGKMEAFPMPGAVIPGILRSVETWGATDRYTGELYTRKTVDVYVSHRTIILSHIYASRY